MTWLYYNWVPEMKGFLIISSRSTQSGFITVRVHLEGNRVPKLVILIWL